MGRPVDWSPVGLDIDPTPGDPVLVLTGGREYLDVADAINGAASAMARLDVDGAVSAAVDALVEAKNDTITKIRKAHDRYSATGDALITYANVLESVQSDTARALVAASAAFDDAHTARTTQAYYAQLADAETDPAVKGTYLQQADLAAQNQAVSRQVVARAQADVASAVEVRDRAAEHAADHIHQVAAGDGLDDSWWDNWGSKIVAAIADVADLVAQAVGPLAMVVAFIPVIGEALAGVLLVVAAVAAITSALANIALAATGKRTWAHAGVAVAGAALSTLGLGTAAGPATGLAKTALTGTLKTSLRASVHDGAAAMDRAPVCKIGFGTCFTAGTLIHTPAGDVPIETLRAGDTVSCFDQSTGIQTTETVEETFARTTTRLIHLTIGDATITATPEHPFMVTGLGWIHAADLHPGDHLVAATEDLDGGQRTVTVDSIRVETLDEADAVTVYNVHVHTHHTYYVLAGDVAVLVHNMAGHKPGAAPAGVGKRARFISDARRTHILDGDRSGGGHRWPGAPGKSPFPREWSDDEIIGHIQDIIADPRSTWSEGGPGGALLTRTGRPARFVVIGKRSGLHVKVVIAPAGEGIITAYPIGGSHLGS